VTVLVTGGAGLIGSHIVDLLLERGQRVRILDNLDAQTHREGRPPWIPDDADFVEGDIRDGELLSRVLEGVEEIYHQAAFGGFTTEISTYYDANATGTARIFEVIAERRLPIRKIVAASSQAIYGEGVYSCEEHGLVQPAMRSPARLADRRWEPPCPVCGRDVHPRLTPEDTRWTGETPYAISKLAEERTVIGMGNRLGIPTVALRYAVTFGPRQSVFNPYTGIVSIFSTLLLNDVPAVVYEDGLQTRDYTFVRDIARANLLVMNDERADGRAFNVGRGQPVTVLELIEKLAAAYGRPPDYTVPGEFRPGDVRHLVHDASEIRKLGWQPETTLEDGLLQVAEWIQSHGTLEEYYSDALERLRSIGVVQSARSSH
jgi:dTDP-L-rhamnose 4-epimerase